MLEICKKCNSEVTQNYCSNCGHPKVLKRIDGNYILQEIRSALSFEKGLLYTVRELSTNPGKSITDFLYEDRHRLLKPVVFLIITSLIYSVFNQIFQFDNSYVQFTDTSDSAIRSISEWIQGNYGYANIIMAVFIAAWIKLFFRKHMVNIFEILVLLCFVMGMGMLIYTVFGVVQGLIDFYLMQVAGIVGFIYLTWAIGQFYGKRKLINYVKALSAYILGMITFSLTAILIGTLIDLLIKQ